MRMLQLPISSFGNARKRWEAADTEITLNDNFISPPPSCDFDVPVLDHWDRRREEWVPLTIRTCQPQPRVPSAGEKRQVSTDRNAGNEANLETYMDAAFRPSCTNEVYLFTKNEYVLLDYVPGTIIDKVVYGPSLICGGYPSLRGTAFGEYGIDSAFGCHDANQAFIFSGNLCAHIDAPPQCSKDKIIKGPISIAKMFPFFKKTVFKSGVYAAFESATKYEAYLFKDDQYALINYTSNDSCLIATGLISHGFVSLKNTIFESGIGAAFASHTANVAYLFKGDSYAHINFTPGTAHDYISGRTKKILLLWSSLRSILPRKNRGVDIHDRTAVPTDADHVHEEP